MFDVFPLFAAAAIDGLFSRTNKLSYFLYPKYSHTGNFNLYLDVG